MKGKEKEEKEAWHVFRWLSCEIRNRKHLRGKPVLFVRALYSMKLLEISFAYSVTWVKRMNAQFSISTSCNNQLFSFSLFPFIYLYLFLSSFYLIRDKTKILSCILSSYFFTRVQLIIFAWNGRLFDRTLVWLPHIYANVPRVNSAGTLRTRSVSSTMYEHLIILLLYTRCGY